jgi:hypothetical protein
MTLNLVGPNVSGKGVFLSGRLQQKRLNVAAGAGEDVGQLSS